MDLRDDALRANYNAKVERILKKILKTHKDLHNDISFHFYEDSLLNNRIIHDPNNRAYSVPSKKEIHLSNTVCELSNDQLYAVILHELLHITFPSFSETQIIQETDQRLKKGAGFFMCP
jgi:predicted metal-dependent hydrolase